MVMPPDEAGMAKAGDAAAGAAAAARGPLREQHLSF